MEVLPKQDTVVLDGWMEAPILQQERMDHCGNMIHSLRLGQATKQEYRWIDALGRNRQWLRLETHFSGSLYEYHLLRATNFLTLPRKVNDTNSTGRCDS